LTARRRTRKSILFFKTKSRPEKRETRLEKFKTALNSLKNAMFTRLNNYDAKNKNVEGMLAGFTTAYHRDAAQSLIDKAITD